MNAPGSKAKGHRFERKVSEMLSLWVSDGKRRDMFWRSASSGSRYSGLSKKSVTSDIDAGDIIGLHPDAALLLDHFVVEVKRKRSMGFDVAMYGNRGTIGRDWEQTIGNCGGGKRLPFLFLKEDRRDELFLLCPTGVDRLGLNKRGAPEPTAILTALPRSPYLFIARDVVAFVRFPL